MLCNILYFNKLYCNVPREKHKNLTINHPYYEPDLYTKKLGCYGKKIDLTNSTKSNNEMPETIMPAIPWPLFFSVLDFRAAFP